MYSCHLFLISTASFKSLTISVFYHAHPCMKCSFDTSGFLEEIASLSHSIVFLFFFVLITEEGFLVSVVQTNILQQGLGFWITFVGDQYLTLKQSFWDSIFLSYKWRFWNKCSIISFTVIKIILQNMLWTQNGFFEQQPKVKWVDWHSVHPT